MFKSNWRIVCVTLLVVGSSAPTYVWASSEPLFADMSETAPYAHAIQFLKTQNFIYGYADQTFQPSRTVTRAEVLAMIFKVAGINWTSSPDDAGLTSQARQRLKLTFPRASDIAIRNTATGEVKNMPSVRDLYLEADTGTLKVVPARRKVKNPFRDIKKSDWFFDIVAEAKRRHIVLGVAGSDFFEPNATVTLVEALRMLYASTETIVPQEPEALPPEIRKNDWFAADVSYAVSQTLLTQLADGSVAPVGKKLTRRDIALLLYRFLRIKDQSHFGYASWYGDGLAKTKLTNGKEFAEKFLTAAHRTLPFGTIVNVMNVENGKTVDVVINDRGPFVTGRIIDLSRTAFSALESPSAGVMAVEVRVRNEE